ncbi:hypothetical protein FDECE_18447, partial [Fusarium decemcellulare]
LFYPFDNQFAQEAMAFRFIFQNNTIHFELNGYDWINLVGIATCYNPGVITNATGPSSCTQCFNLIVPTNYYPTSDAVFDYGADIYVTGRLLRDSDMRAVLLIIKQGPVGNSIIWQQGANGEKHKANIDAELKEKLEDEVKKLGFGSISDALDSIRQGPQGLQGSK